MWRLASLLGREWVDALFSLMLTCRRVLINSWARQKAVKNGWNPNRPCIFPGPFLGREGKKSWDLRVTGTTQMAYQLQYGWTMRVTLNALNPKKGLYLRWETKKRQTWNLTLRPPFPCSSFATFLLHPRRVCCFLASAKASINGMFLLSMRSCCCYRCCLSSLIHSTGLYSQVPSENPTQKIRWCFSMQEAWPIEMRPQCACTCPGE